MSNAQPEKMKLSSMDIAEAKRDQLRQVLQGLLPEAVNENGIDIEQLKRAIGEWIEPGKERFGLQWPGKAECMKIIQQPSVATLRPAREESVDFDTTENLFIEGDNLEVLKLLQKPYFGKVKLIYIDPPYNTGKEFIYPDKYAETLDTYLEYSGQKDSEGRKFSTNTETAGRYHTNWLNMLYPRLYLAKNLLAEDGFIFISIDDNEQANLTQMCNELFGEENFIATIVWQKRTSPDARKAISTGHEYVLMYAKNYQISKELIESLPLTEEQKLEYKNPDNDPRGPWVSSDFTAQIGHATPQQFYTIKAPNGKQHVPPPGTCWKNIESVFKAKLAEGRFWFGKDGNGFPRRKTYLSETEGRTVWTWWTNKEVGHGQEATKELKDLFDAPNIFDNPKPVRLLKRILQIVGDKDAIILDFFAGSSTTAHAVMDMNIEDQGTRKFIMVQLPEKCDEQTDAYKAGFKTIADSSRQRIRLAAKKMSDKIASQLEFNANDFDLGFKCFKLDRSNFKIWNGSVDQIDNLEKQLSLHVDHIAKTTTPESILYELLLKAGFPLITKVEKVKLAGKEVFSIHEGALLICLEKELTQQLIDALADANPVQVICLDEGFNGNDQLKANAVQTFKARAQAEESEIVFKTV